VYNVEAEIEDGSEAPLNQVHCAKHNYAFVHPLLLNESVGMAFFNRGYNLEVNIYDFSRGQYLDLSPAGTDRTLPLMLNFTVFECQKF
jgi:hypothetical protein